jgi:hypothetical protein
MAATPATESGGLVSARSGRYRDRGAPARGPLGSSHRIMSDRAEIELIDNAGDRYAPDPISVVRLP